jgi:uncharacterized protein (TIGR02118 family)
MLTWRPVTTVKTGRNREAIPVKNQTTNSMKKGMIKVSVLYPNGEGKSFDIDYYCNKHVPMVGGLLGDAVKAATVEKGLGGAEPGSTATYAAMGNLYFSSMADFENSFGPNADKIMADLPNFTNIEPVLQVSEVMI